MPAPKRLMTTNHDELLTIRWFREIGFIRSVRHTGHSVRFTKSISHDMCDCLRIIVHTNWFRQEGQRSACSSQRKVPTPRIIPIPTSVPDKCPSVMNLKPATTKHRKAAVNPRRATYNFQICFALISQFDGGTGAGEVDRRFIGWPSIPPSTLAYVSW